MASVMAIVSKAVFEREARGHALGDVWATGRYASTHRALAPLASGGALYLVTVRPPNERLWLVAVLQDPERDAAGWAAGPNVAAIRDITALRDVLRFANDKPLSQKPGALGMSLQTPRELSDADVAALAGARPRKARAKLTAPDAPPGRPQRAAPKKKKKKRTKTREPRALMDDGFVTDALARLEGTSTGQLRERVEELAELPPDARVARRLAALVVAPPYTSGSLRPMWRSVLTQLTERHVDREAFAALQSAPIEAVFGATNMGQWLRKEVDRAIERLRAQLGDVTPAQREPVQTGAAPATEDALLLQIGASPDDDAARLVYADLAAERGDTARAELIHLQLARAKSGEAASDHELDLLRKHAARWLAPIKPVLKGGSWVFERGFLHACTVYPRKGKALELAGHPLWSTVYEARLSETGDPAPIVTHPVMRSLRVVHLWTYPRGLAGILASDAPIEELHHVYVPNVTRDKALWRAFVACERLPKLRLVELGGATPDEAVTLLSGGLAREGMNVFIGVHNYALGPWLTTLATAGPTKHPTVTMLTRHGETQVNRAARTIKCTLDPRTSAEGLWDFALGTGALALGAAEGNHLPSGEVERVEVRVPKGGVTGNYPHHKPRTPKSVLEELARFCASQGIAFSTVEGDWKLAYLDRHHLHL